MTEVINGTEYGGDNKATILSNLGDAESNKITLDDGTELTSVQEKVNYILNNQNSNLSYQLRWSSTEYKGSAKIIDCGFKPKYIFACSVGVNNTIGCRWFVYDETVSTTQVTYSVGNSGAKYENINSNATFCLTSVDDNGFTMTKDFFNQAGWCFAIK